MAMPRAKSDGAMEVRDAIAEVADNLAIMIEVVKKIEYANMLTANHLSKIHDIHEELVRISEFQEGQAYRTPAR